MPRKVSTQLMNMARSKLAIWTIHSYILVSLVGESILQATERGKKHRHQPCHKAFNLQSVLPAICIAEDGDTKDVVDTQCLI